MEHLFYMFALLFILWETRAILTPKKVTNLYIRSKRNLRKSDSKTDVVMGINAIYSIWVTIGVLSSQWYFFVILFIFGIIPKRYVNWTFIDGIISVVLLSLIVLNKYFFKIDLLNVLF